MKPKYYKMSELRADAEAATIRELDLWLDAAREAAIKIARPSWIQLHIRTVEQIRKGKREKNDQDRFIEIVRREVPDDVYRKWWREARSRVHVME